MNSSTREIQGMNRDFRVVVSSLLNGTTHELSFGLRGSLPDLFVTSSRVEPGEAIVVEGQLEAAGAGLLATIRIQSRFVGDCVRCLERCSGEIEVSSRELFTEGDTSEDTYGFSGEAVDLSEVVRDLVIMSLPVVPLCSPDCRGLCQLCGASLNLGPCSCDRQASDPRWAALDQLHNG